MRDHGIGQPPEPFEEIIGMARPAPQPDVADPALVGGIGPERLELRIRQRLAGDADQQDQRAQIIRQPQRRRRESAPHKDRERQRDRSEPLVLQKDEHPSRRIGTPFPGEGGITGIVGYPGGADRDMRPRAAATRSRPAPPPAIAGHWAAAPSTGHKALPTPTRPSEKVQIVSTQPELPVRCCTTQAPAIRTESDTAMAASASRYKTVMKNPGWTSNRSKIR